MTDSFLAPLHAALERMAEGARIVRGIDPAPPCPTDGKIHPVAKARQDSSHFSLALPYPDGDGQSVKGELEAFLARLEPFPPHSFRISVNGISIRLELGNSIQFNERRVVLLGGKLTQGCYEDMKGIRARAWSL